MEKRGTMLKKDRKIDITKLCFFFKYENEKKIVEMKNMK